MPNPDLSMATGVTRPAEVEQQHAEEARKAGEAEAARRSEEEEGATEARRAEESRAADAARQVEEIRQAEEERRAEQARHAEAARRAAEEERLAQEARAAEEAKRLEEERRAEEARRAEVEARRVEAERQAEDAVSFRTAETAATGAPALPTRKRRLSWPIAALVSLIGAFVVLVLALGVLHLGASRPAGSAITASPAPSTRPTALSAPAPAQSWRFPRLAAPADQVILTFNNPGGSRAAITVAVSGSKQGISLQPQGEAEMELGGSARTGSIGITSTAPIIAGRIVVKNGTTTTSYGSHR
jgi:hypothetical protein